MNISQLSKLSVEELRQLNHDVVSVLNAKVRAKQVQLAAKFNIGDTVLLNRRNLKGTVIKINQKSIIVKTERGDWKCSPSLLTLV